MTDVAQRILIVGGGIAGLGLAKGLASNGFEVCVAELHGHTNGSGVGFWAFGVRAFEQLGLRAALESNGDLPVSAKLCQADGTVLMEVSGPRIEGTDYPPEVIISRPVLATAMLESARAAGARVQIGLSIETYEDRGDQAYVRFTDGTTRKFDLVVGADGAFSTVRSRFFDASIAPEIVSAGCWRALIPYDPVAATPHVWDGGTHRVFMYPCGRGMIYTGIQCSFAEPRRTAAEGRGRFTELLAGFSVPQIDYARRAIADGAMQAEFRAFNFHFIETDWYKGRLVLIGDAAHSMSPHISSGAGMAIEDAVVLTEELGRRQPLPQALANFMHRRQPRVKGAYMATRGIFAAAAADIESWSAESVDMNAILQFLAENP